MPRGAEVVFTPLTGYDLLDYLGNVSSLVVVDTVVSGKAAPGTVFVLREEDFRSPHGCSPHYLGLLEPLALARRLGLPVADHVIFVAVEAADCTTVGGEMDPAVLAAVPVVVDLVAEILRTRSSSLSFSGGPPSQTSS